MAVRTVYDDGALRVMGGLSAPKVGAGQAFGAGVQQRQEQRKSELGMDATQLNMEQTRQTMRLREEAAKRAAAANARAQAQRAAQRAFFAQQLNPVGVPDQQAGRLQMPSTGGVRTPTENFRDFGGDSQVPLSFGSAGAPSTGGAGAGASGPQVGLQYPATPAGGPQLATAGLTTQPPMPAAAPAGVQIAGLSGPEAFRLAMQSQPEMFGVQTAGLNMYPEGTAPAGTQVADASGATPAAPRTFKTVDGGTVSLDDANPAYRPIIEQGLAAGPDPVFATSGGDGYIVYSDGRVFDIEGARSGQDPFDVPPNVQANLRARAGVTAAPEAAPEAAPAAPRTFKDIKGNTFLLDKIGPSYRPAFEQGVAAGPDPVLINPYFVYSDGRVFDITEARRGRDPFDVPANVQADLRTRAGVNAAPATPEAAPEAAPVSPTERSFMAPDAMQQRASMAQAPGPQALPAAGGEFVPVSLGSNSYEVNPVTGEVRTAGGRELPSTPVTDIEDRNYLISMAVGQLNAEKRQLEDQFQRIQTALTEREPTRMQQEAYNRVQQELQRVNQLLSPEPLRNTAQATTLFTPRGVGAEEGPGVAGPAPVTLTTTPEGTSVVTAPAPASASAPTTESGAEPAAQTQQATEQAAKQATSFTLEDQLKLSERLTGKQRLTLLSEPRALNPEIERAYTELDRLNNLMAEAGKVGLYEQAFKIRAEAQTLANNIGLMTANQAVNEAIYYNAPARLEAILSGTSLGPVRVRAYRKGNEAVFSVETPGGQPLSQQLTEMTKAELSSVVRPFFDKEYAAAQAKAAAESQAAFDKAYATERGKVIGEAEGEAAVRAALGLPANQTLEYVTSTTVIDSENNAADALVFKTEDGKTFSVHEEIGPSGTRERVTREYYAPPVIGQ